MDLSVGFGLEFIDEGFVGLLILFFDVNNSLRRDDGRKLLFGAPELSWVVDGWNCCWFDILPNAAVQSASKLLLSFSPRRSMLLLVSDDDGERRSEKSFSCSTDDSNKSTRLSSLFDVVGVVLVLAADIVAWSIVVNFSNSSNWSSSWSSEISINALIGSVRSIVLSKYSWKTEQKFYLLNFSYLLE